MTGNTKGWGRWSGTGMRGSWVSVSTGGEGEVVEGKGGSKGTEARREMVSGHSAEGQGWAVLLG